MLDRNKTILSAAFDVFTRYGVKRATMNDIASEAGVARQTLYNAFDNKESLLRALILMHVEETCAVMTEHLQSNGSLEDGLELAFDQFARKPYELLRKTHHGGEIMEALDDAASDEMNESKERFGQAMIAMLEPHIPENAPANMNAAVLADFVVHTAMGHKVKASSEEHLERLLATLKTLVLDAVKGQS